MVDAIQLMTLLGLGLFLGLKHALDADHVVAVSTIVSHTRSLKKSSLVGILWGLGHTLALFLVGILLLSFRFTLPYRIALSFELLVGMVLIFLGIDVLRKIKKGKTHLHEHKHGNSMHVHFHSHDNYESHIHTHKSFAVGMVHGLAGSSAIMLLILTTVSSIFQGLLFIALFGVGTILGMLAVSTVISLLFMVSSKFDKIQNGLRILAGVFSIVFGSGIVYEVGFLIF